jgi:quercetin dioxygenase-like cupin family protein
MESHYIDDVLIGLDIPEAGVLSRVLHRDGGVRLVGFAFDTGQELTEHTSASTAIVQVASGEIDFTVDGSTRRMGPRSWLIMPPHRPHSLVAVEPATILLTLVQSAPAVE